ncbi:hypothetical protein KJ756_02210 [Patescibacteria group bacterium]|nr:hypothetical protein [Patescibacteria group bacterium]
MLRTSDDADTLGEILFKIFMENEKHFYPTPESNEQPTREYSVNFLSSSHPDAEKAEKTYDTQELVSMMNKWWKQICAENNLDPNDKKLKNINYYIMELGKNALEVAEGGKIKVILEPNKIKVVVTDDMGWDGDPNDDILYKQGHGLSQVKRYADEFTIETNGAKFTKVPKKKKLVKSEDTDIKHGSKISFIKNFE